MSIQINFKKVENISFDERIHSYAELMEEMRTKNMYNQCEQKKMNLIYFIQELRKKRCKK